MDKKEFYKQLMSEYTFNEEKIRRNAKRKPSNSFLTSKWMPLSAAAAVFVTVYGGYMILTPLMNDGNNVLPDTGISASGSETDQVSAYDRLTDIEFKGYLINSNKLSAMENKTMYISFQYPMTYNQYTSILNTLVSDTGEIVTEALWNGKFISLESIKADNSDNNEYTAAKILAPVGFYNDIKDVSAFFSVEFDSKINDDNFEPLINEPVTTERPVETSTTIPTETVSTTAPPVTEVPTDTGTKAPETASTPETSAPVNPLEIKMLQIPAENVIDVKFINNNRFFVLTRDNIFLYEINNELGYTELASFKSYNSRITYQSPDDSTFVILGGVDDLLRRTELFIADGVTGELVQIDTSAITADANIVYAYYNGSDVFIKTLASDSSYNAFYIASYDGSDFWIDKLEQFSAPTSVLHFDNKCFIYSITDDGGLTELYKKNYKDGSAVRLELDIDGAVHFVRSNYLDNFAIIMDDGTAAWIWNASTETLSDKLVAENLSFSSYSGDVFTDGSAWYTLYGNSIQVIDAEPIYEEPQFSSRFSIYEVSPEGIKIEVKA